MPIFQSRNLIAMLAASALIAAAPPGQQRVKRVAKSVAEQSQGGTAATTTGAGAGAGAAGAGAAAGAGVFQSSWIWALGGLIAAGGLTAAALSGDEDPPVSPAS